MKTGTESCPCGQVNILLESVKPVQGAYDFCQRCLHALSAFPSLTAEKLVPCSPCSAQHFTLLLLRGSLPWLLWVCPLNTTHFQKVCNCCVSLQAHEQSCWTLLMMNYNFPASWEITSTSSTLLEIVTRSTCVVWCKSIKLCKATNCSQPMERSSRLIFQLVLL